MICEHCAAGGDLTREPGALVEATRRLAFAAHAKCPGSTWCPCQHQVPPAEVLTARREAMPRGGLARVVGNLAELQAPAVPAGGLARGDQFAALAQERGGCG